MFEISIAVKYLLPKKKQLSVSLISLMSVLVISLVVWLVLVFLSVTEGIEKKWLDKLTSLHAPLRITPTEAYYSSYYHQIDSLSANSHFRSKNIAQKWAALDSDPYCPDEDGQIPLHFPPPDLMADGTLKDPVKSAYHILENIQSNVPSLIFQDFEMGGALLRLQLLRGDGDRQMNHSQKSQSFLTQAAYIASFPDKSPYVHRLILPIRPQDLNHLYFIAPHALEHSREDAPKMTGYALSHQIASRFQVLAKHFKIQKLKTIGATWSFPQHLFPKQGRIRATAHFHQGLLNHCTFDAHLSQSIIQNGVEGDLILQDGALLFQSLDGKITPITSSIPLILTTPLTFEASLQENSLLSAQRLGDLNFEVKATLQGHPIAGMLPWNQLEIEDAKINPNITNIDPHLVSWVTSPNPQQAHLPINEELESGILLAKNFQDNGVMIGDRGYLSYSTATTSALQEQRLPIFVAGFYDPGVMSIGAKCILTPPAIAHTIHAASSAFHLNKTEANGIAIWFDNLHETDQYKAQIVQAFDAAGISSYWNVTSFKEYDFAKDLLEQFQSDQYLFTLIGIIILMVACCNIISLLVLLVNDKKREIGVLQAMGASSYSIAAIFGTCGILMGIISSCIGTIGALFTLYHIDSIVHFLSMIQGHNAFNAAFFGNGLPNQLSHSAVLFILIVTPLLSLLAGLVPAIKACRLKPSEILRSE